MAILLALAAATVYGAADFFGGLASRRTAAVTVVVLSQLAGMAVLAIVWLALPGRFYAGDVVWGLLAGVGGGVGIAALYAGLAVGRMGVVSPISAVIGASVPVLTGLAQGERPGTLPLIGVACAFVAVALVSANAETMRLSWREPGLAPAILSGLGIGMLYVCLAHGHADAGLARVAVARAASLLLLVCYALARRESLRPAPGAVATILLAGALDMSANVLYVLATGRGLLAIVAVLTSLYPASTVFLAWAVLKERLTGSQWAGVALAACGVALIAASSG